jgi:hypothetical protein
MHQPHVQKIRPVGRKIGTRQESLANREGDESKRAFLTCYEKRRAKGKKKLMHPWESGKINTENEWREVRGK